MGLGAGGWGVCVEECLCKYAVIQTVCVCKQSGVCKYAVGWVAVVCVWRGVCTYAVVCAGVFVHNATSNSIHTNVTTIHTNVTTTQKAHWVPQHAQ